MIEEITNRVVSPTTISGPDKKQSTVDYQSFLRLLVAQMKNQDPTNPTDSSEYLSQLASFSNVEQAIQMNTKLDSLMASTNLNIGANLIGKNIYWPSSGVEGRVAAVIIDQGAVSVELESGDTLPIGAEVKIR